MLKPLHLLPQNPSMQSLKTLFPSKNLFIRLPIRSQSRFHCSTNSFFHIGGQGREDNDDSSRNSAEKSVSWSSYDPFTDQLHYNKEEESNQELSSPDGEGTGKSRVCAVYDPIEGRMVTTVIGDAGQKEKGNEVKKSSGKEKAKEEVRKSKFSIDSAYVGRKKGGKLKDSWVCENCGQRFGQWWGTCPSCRIVGTVVGFSETEVNRARGVEISQAVARSWLKSRESVPQSLANLNTGRNQSEWRIPLPGHLGMEVARVLGGGIVPGSLVLVGGDPGVGKSTLLLQIADMIAQGQGPKGPVPVVYVSGEESIDQIASRAERMKITTKNLFLYSSTDIEDILDKIQKLEPQALIVDSIQTVYLRGVTGSAGNIMQVKECTSALLRFAKETNVPVFLIGHVTKAGDIAGPRILEHIVDVVLYMEGERYSSYRLLRSVKNRFGSTDEIGVFELSESGLQAVLNPSEIFLSEHSSDSEVLTGLAVAVIVDGSRTFLIEIQALCVTDTSMARQVNGIQPSRADMIISVLMKQAGLKLQNNTIFLNVVSGVKVTETAGDLAVAAAICSSFLEIPIPADVAFIGEVGLGGELRTVPRMDKRVMAVAKLGYKKCVVPKAAEKSLSVNSDIQLVGCRNLKDVINSVFQAD